MKTTFELLESMRNKGCVYHCQDRIPSLFKSLKERLTLEEFRDLKTAHSHYILGEGSEEFYEVCKQLIKKYK